VRGEGREGEGSFPTKWILIKLINNVHVGEKTTPTCPLQALQALSPSPL